MQLPYDTSSLGKTTLTRELQSQLSLPPHNLKVASFSLDDFYLSRDDQAKLSCRSRGNRLLEFRGNPGTHDLPLLQLILDQLLEGKPGTVSIPTYNKVACGGLGDRNPQHAWTEVKLPVDIILFEGWMLGFQPLRPLALSEILTKEAPHASDHPKTKEHVSRLRNHPPADLEQMNDRLGLYAPIWEQLDAMILLYPESLEHVYSWRLQQEPKEGLSPVQVRDFVDRFMPAYELYLENACRCKKRLLKIELDFARNVKSEATNNFGS